MKRWLLIQTYGVAAFVCAALSLGLAKGYRTFKTWGESLQTKLSQSQWQEAAERARKAQQ